MSEERTDTFCAGRFRVTACLGRYAQGARIDMEIRPHESAVFVTLQQWFLYPPAGVPSVHWSEAAGWGVHSLGVMTESLWYEARALSVTLERTAKSRPRWIPMGNCERFEMESGHLFLTAHVFIEDTPPSVVNHLYWNRVADEPPVCIAGATRTLQELGSEQEAWAWSCGWFARTLSMLSEDAEESRERVKRWQEDPVL